MFKSVTDEELAALSVEGLDNTKIYEVIKVINYDVRTGSMAPNVGPHLMKFNGEEVSESSIKDIQKVLQNNSTGAYIQHTNYIKICNSRNTIVAGGTVGILCGISDAYDDSSTLGEFEFRGDLDATIDKEYIYLFIDTGRHKGDN